MGRVPEIKFKPSNILNLCSVLFSAYFCRDTIMYHVAKRIFGSKTDGMKWRQMVIAGTEGLHIMPGRITKAHLDAISPVVGREPNGDCRYSMQHVVPHATYDLWKWRHLKLFPGLKLRPGESPRPGEVIPILEWRF
jgi:hypothetical protein